MQKTNKDKEPITSLRDIREMTFVEQRSEATRSIDAIAI